MGTYAQPGITQGQALMAENADYASGLSKTLKTARTSMDNQMAMIETSKNALAKQTAELMQEANKIQSSDNSELADSFKQTVIDQIDALDLLEYNSIGRDQTEVTKMRSNLLNGVEGATSNFMKLLAEAEDYNKRVVNGTSPKTVSNTNSNPEAIPFLNALGVNGGKQVKTEWDGLGFNLSYKDPSTGKEFKINPTNYYAGREQGLPGLWNEVQDPSPTFKASYDQLAKNFPNINKVTEKKVDGKLVTTTSLDSEKAYDNIRNGILNDKIIRNGINGDTMQFLSGSGYYDKGIGVTYDPENGDQEDELMEAIANYTMDQYSKGKGEQVRDIRTKLDETKPKSTLAREEFEFKKQQYYDKQKLTTVDYNEILKPAETLKSLLQNPNQGTRNKELVTEENKMRFESLSSKEKKAKETLETSLNNRFFGQNFGTQSEPIIIAKGEIAINNNGELMYFPKYNKTTKGVTDLVTIESYNNGIPLTEDFLFRFEKKLNKAIGEDVKLKTKPNFTPEDIEKINEAKINGGKVQLSDGKTYTIKKTK